MKNSTMNAIYTTLTSVDFENKTAIMDELYNELHRNDDAKNARLAEYESACDAVMEAIRVAGVPVSVADIFAEAQKSLPEGFTKNKVSYGLRNYWKDKVVVESGKVNLYSLKKGA